jgi:NADH-quinone oxidoreductase subunit E
MTNREGRDAAGRPGRGRKGQSPGRRDTGGRGTRLDPDVERWFADAGAKFPRSRSSIIPMLQSVQAALGYVPADAMQVIAGHMAVPPAVIEGVASFYAQFRFRKPGRHCVTVCSGTACYVRGSRKLMEDLQADLMVGTGGTTGDGAVTLESVSCFGACALAPVVVLDDKVLRQQTTASLRRALEEVAAADAAGDGRDDGDERAGGAGANPAGREAER